MKRIHQEKGERDWAFEDLQSLQSESLKAIDSIFSPFGDCVISGCEVVGNAIGKGLVCIGGRVMPFDGATDVVFPCKLISSVEDITGEYIDGGIKPIAHSYKAIIAADGEGIDVFSTGIESLLRHGSDATDSDSSATFATSKAIKTLADNINNIDLSHLQPKADETLITESKEVVGAINELKETVDTNMDGFKVGEIRTVYGSNIDLGEKYLPCNGSTYDPLDYPYLNTGLVASTIVMPPNIGYINAIGYGNGIFVCGSNYITSTPNLLISSDGLIWEKIVIPNIGYINAITYGNGMFICGGGDNGSYTSKLLTSKDGRIWTLMTPPNIGYITDIAFDNGTFICVSDRASLIKSTNGTTWELITSSNIKSIRTLTYGNGMFIGGGGEDNYSGKIISNLYVSIDGTIWEKIVPPNIGAITDITYGNGIFICSGCDTSLPELLISTDGVTWKKTPLNNINTNVKLTYGNGMFILTESSSNLFISMDGITWKRLSIPYFQGIDKSTYGNGKFIYGNNHSGDNISKILILMPSLPSIENSYIKVLK